MAKVTRSGVSSLLLPDEVSETILRGAAENSLIARYGRTRPMRAQNVKLTEAEISGANVYWVGEGQRKSTDAPTMVSATWSMSAAELAVIVPLDENVQDDASADLFELYKPAIETAIARKIDSAALFGLDAPTEWGAGVGIVPQAKVVGNDVDVALASVTMTALLDALAGTGAATPDGILQMVEDHGFDPTAFLAYTRMRSKLRGLKDADGRHVFGGPTAAGVPGDLFGLPIEFTKAEVWNATAGAGAYVVTGDWGQALLGTRAGIKYKIFDQGVITDGAGNVVYSLMESDMIALRVTARYGFKVYADDTADGETLGGSSEYPFAILRETP